MITRTMPINNVYSSEEAAEYLGLTLRGLKYHLYEVKDLQSDGDLGGNLMFTKATLDEFKARKRSVGRPVEADNAQRPKRRSKKSKE